MVLTAALDCGAAPMTPDAAGISLKTKSFALHFEVRHDHRLYQLPIGGEAMNKPLARGDEAYPQAGDGYIWEPALQAVHADGNTSTALFYEGVARAQQPAGR